MRSHALEKIRQLRFLDTSSSISSSSSSSGRRRRRRRSSSSTSEHRFLANTSSSSSSSSSSGRRRRRRSSSSSSRSSSNSNDHLYIIASCIKGQATSIPELEEGGTSLVIPSSGYCLNDQTDSTFISCVGVQMYSTTDSTTGDCSGINSSKLTKAPSGWSCKVGEVQGVKFSVHYQASCSDFASTFIVSSNTCFQNIMGLRCDSSGSEKITWTYYNKYDECQAGTEESA